MKRTECSAILTRAYLTFPHLELDKETVIAWHSFFPEEKAEDFAAALDLCLMAPGRRFLPTVGEVAEAIRKIKVERSDAEPFIPPEQVWARLCDFAKSGMSEGGLMQKLEPYPCVAKTVECIGWEHIRYLPFDELKFLQRRFCELYRELHENQEWRERRKYVEQISGKISILLNSVPGQVEQGPKTPNERHELLDRSKRGRGA